MAVNRNTIKFLACVFMLTDHVGFFLFPSLTILRLIGRLAFPIFAFFIAEGAHYTRSKIKYFLSLFSFAFLTQMIFILFKKEMPLNSLFTFSFSLLLIYSYFYFKEKKRKIFLFIFILLILLFALNGYKDFIDIDYGFWGILSSFFAYLPYTLKKYSFEKQLFLLIFPLIMLGIVYGVAQFFALAAIPLLTLYDKDKKCKRIKWEFYIFFPFHFLIILLFQYFFF